MSCENPPCKSFPSLPQLYPDVFREQTGKNPPTLYRSATGSPYHNPSLCQSPFRGSSHIYLLSPVPGPLHVRRLHHHRGHLPRIFTMHSSTDDEEGQLAPRRRSSHVSAHYAVRRPQATCGCGAPERWPVLTKSHTCPALRAKVKEGKAFTSNFLN